MKYLIFLFITLLFFSCSPAGEVKETQTVIKTENSVTKFINTQIYPVLSSSKNISLSGLQKSISTNDPVASELTTDGANGYLDINPVDVADDFNNGWFYWNNSYNADSVIHTLDLSSITGGGMAYIAIDFSLIDGYHGNASFQIRAHNSPYQWQSASCQYGQPGLVWVLTDNEGKIDWKQGYSNPFDAITHLASPGYHDYQYAKFIFTAKWLVTGVVVE